MFGQHVRWLPQINVSGDSTAIYPQHGVTMAPEDKSKDSRLAQAMSWMLRHNADLFYASRIFEQACTSRSL